MPKTNNLIRKEVWMTKEEVTQLEAIAKVKGTSPKALLEFAAGSALVEYGIKTMLDRAGSKIVSGSKRGTRPSPVTSKRGKKLRKIKGVLVHEKGSTLPKGSIEMDI